MNDPAHDEPTFQADLSVDARGYPLYERVYLLLAASFAVLLVLTNILGIKLFVAPGYEITSRILFFLPADANGFALTTGIITYPLTFLITDLVSEIYGKRRADFMVLVGFLMSVLMLIIAQIALRVPPHMYWVPPPDPQALGFFADWVPAPFYDSVGGYQHAFASVFSLNGVLLLGSMCAYAVAQLSDNWLYHFWKRTTKGRHLWLRNNGSTVISQLLDTAIVNSFLFFIGFGWGLWQAVQVMVVIYVYKVIIALLDTPLIYLGVFVLRRVLGDQAEPAEHPA
jgi:uncharacterized PurR-regulated membrane protein YhhQ (DUF165 family)